VHKLSTNAIKVKAYAFQPGNELHSHDSTTHCYMIFKV